MALLVQSQTHMEDQDWIQTWDGWQLAATVHHPRAATARKVAVVAAAIGARRHRYAAFARHLAKLGWTVLTFDYRGIGSSHASSPSTPAATLLDWGRGDIDSVIGWAWRQLQPNHVVAVVHSIGGQLIAITPNSRLLSAVVAVSPPRPHWWLWEGPYRYAVFGFFRMYVPTAVKCWGRLPLGAVGLHDLPRDVALEWARTALDPGGWAELHRRAAADAATYDTPTLVVSFEDDRRIAPYRTVEALTTTLYAQAPLTWWHVDPARHAMPAIGHSGFFDGLVPVSWWSAVSNWLDDRLHWMRGALPC